MWIDNDFPKLLGAELYRPHPGYIIEMAVGLWLFTILRNNQAKLFNLTVDSIAVFKFREFRETLQSIGQS